MARLKKDLFLSHVGQITLTGCHLWTAACGRHGYGQFRYEGGMKLAHRVAYMLFVGVIPPGMCVLHRCDTPVCVNPAHLWLGTHKDNMKDMANKGRCNAPFGERHGNSKLTLSQVRCIAKDPRPSRAVAKDYGVCKSSVNHIRSGQSWGKAPLKL